MAVSLDLSHEFDSLVKRLQKTPDDPMIKIEILKRLPDMMALAQTNPIVLYRLAQSFAPSSDQYKQMMRQSADGGCTNAMLAICQDKLKSTSPTEIDLKTVAHYMALIECSQDSYIIKQSRSLLDSHPEVSTFMKAELKTDSYKHGLRFFGIPSENNSFQESDNENSLTI